VGQGWQRERWEERFLTKVLKQNLIKKEKGFSRKRLFNTN
jgi:IS4 transposase